MKWYFYVLKNHSDFTGRARRTEYWMFALINFLITLLVLTIDFIQSYYTGVFGLLYLPYNLIILIPSFAVGVRRLHDTGNSGWMFLINLIPIVGGIWFFILSVTDSSEGANKWGQNPKDQRVFDI